ncbi:MAG: MBG domain-containing protein [Oscillospiraceae bacterium]
MVYGVNNENEGKFTLVYPEDKCLIPSEGNLVFSSTPPADEHTHGVDGGEGDIVWTKWDGTTSLTAGNYYIENNITLSKTINVSGAVNLCLNGCTISRTGGNEVFSVTGKLTICDCEGGGTVSGTRSGGALGVSGGTATITGGTVNGVKLQNRAELYLGGAPDVGTVSMAKSGTAKGYDNQIFAAADGTAYAGDKITLTSDDDNIPENTVIVRSVNDDNKGLFELTDYALEKSGDNLVIKAASAIELSVTVPSGLTYGDTKPLTITVEPADAALEFAFAGQSPNDNGSDKFSVTKGSDGTYSLYAGAVGNFILTVTATKDGYSQKQETVSFSVGKAALIVTADNATVAYGEPKPEFTAQINGFVNGEGKGDLTGTLEFDCAYAAGSPVGTYPITPKGLTSNNYSISFVDGTLTVTENAVPMPTAPVGKTLTYNSGLQDLIIPGSAEHGTMYYSLSQNGPWYTAVPQAKDAGVYTVWYKVVGDPGYSDTAPNSVTAVINKAPLTIKALDRRAYVGERMPAFAYDVVGLLGSDTLDKAPSFSCNANMNMPGTYVIRIFGAEAANYDISYVNGILTVEHRFVIPGYKITVVVVGKGEASASAGWADAGSVISVSSKADEGYTLGSITVETESGRSVAMKDGKFTMPNDSVVVTVTFEKKGEPFYDVRPGDWFYDAVTWASKNGIVLGVTEDTYRPNDPVTREQLAAILFRYADYKGYDTSASADLTGYADYAEVSAYAVPALRWACGCGIIDGSAGKLDPRSGATRAQLATMLMRFDKAAK